MPKNVVVKAPREDRNTLLEAVHEAQFNPKQTPEEVWCVVGINDAHILTVWSQSRESSWVRPSGHAEEILVKEYAHAFQAGRDAMRKGVNNKVEIFLKKSPCNYGAGDCYDMLRRFLLKNCRGWKMYIIYQQIYGGYNGRYEATSEEAMEEFEQLPLGYTEYLDYYETFQETQKERMEREKQEEEEI